MSRKNINRQSQLNHHADALNSNRGSPGTNVTNAKVHGNRGKLMNPNQRGTAQPLGSVVEVGKRKRG